MTDTRTQDAPQTEESSEMIFGAGESAWLAVVTVLAALGVALGIVAIILANDDSGGTAGPPFGGGAGTPVAEADVSATEFAFDPAELALVAAQDATITLHNDGGVEHNLTVLRAGEIVESEADFDEGLVLDSTEDVAAGETSELTLNLEPGEYEMICTIPGHLDGGMRGTLAAS